MPRRCWWRCSQREATVGELSVVKHPWLGLVQSNGPPPHTAADAEGAVAIAAPTATGTVSGSTTAAATSPRSPRRHRADLARKPLMSDPEPLVPRRLGGAPAQQFRRRGEELVSAATTTVSWSFRLAKTTSPARFGTAPTCHGLVSQFHKTMSRLISWQPRPSRTEPAMATERWTRRSPQTTAPVTFPPGLSSTATAGEEPVTDVSVMVDRHLLEFEVLSGVGA